MKAIVATTGLHIRERASKNSKSLDEASYGEELLVLSGKPGDLWIKVKYLKRGAVGYVNSKNVILDAPPDVEPPFTPPREESGALLGLITGIVLVILGSIIWFLV